MFKIIHSIIKNYKILKSINKLSAKKIKIIFYSEDKTYLKFSYLLIELLSEIYPNQILYVSSNKNDYINNLNVKNLYIGKNFFLQYFFLKIKADNIFLTTIDLNNNILKKTKNVKRYIYFFHSPVSTTRAYTNKAFDNYDVILCNGDYQINEIRKREKLNNLKKKKLIRSGYLYFDYLKNNFDSLKQKKIVGKKETEILIAPSWNYKEINFINEDFEKIIEKLLHCNYIVKFRPHPEHLKRSLNFINKIRSKFNSKNFFFDDEIENINSMKNAKCLITDNSGIAIEFSLVLKKPTLYYESKIKIHNDEIKDYESYQNLEDVVKNHFGYKFNYNKIDKIDVLIDDALKDFDKKKINIIEKFAKKNFFNIFNTARFIKNNIKEIIY
jgi:YidC/Oxa1 family membrane protein insertase